MCWTLVAAALLALLAALVYAFGTLAVRPLDIVEGEILFEAQRLRNHLPLYVDPALGARDYGAVPSRYHVLYTPLWPFVLALVPERLAAIGARLTTGVAWFGLLGVTVGEAPAHRRKATLFAAAFAGGTFMLARHCATASADVVAVVLAAAAVFRSVRLGRVDALSGALFALGAWTKPNVIGLAAGALLHEMIVGRARSVSPLGAALVVSGVLALWTDRLSGGVWLTHLASSTMQPATFARGLEQIVPRFPFLGAPHLFAAYFGFRARSEPRVRFLLAVLSASLVWTMIGMAKLGSATNYWLEPSFAAVLLMAHAPIPRMGGVAPAARWLAALAALVVLGLNAQACLWATREARVRRDAIGRVRARCGAALSDLVLAEHPGLEMMLDGRMIETPFQMTHLLRQGRYPLELWKSDVAAPEVRCLVTESDLLERPLSEVNVDEDRFGPEMRAALVARFELVARDGGYWIYRARDARSP
jgi:hypothetical protein